MTTATPLPDWHAKAAALRTDGRPFIDGQRVDAACSGSPGKVEYRGVL